MHKLRQIIRKINQTHKGLGAMIAMNLLTAKAKKVVLNVAPSGCGKSGSTDTVAITLKGDCKKFTSMTLAGLVRLKDEFNYYDGHVVIDDLGGEKSLWSRLSTVTVLANLVYTHFVRKLTHSGEIRIEDFTGSVSLNIQPVMMHSLVQTDEWIAVIRDKVIRYYHLFRPLEPKDYLPEIDVEWGKPLHYIAMPKYRGKLWYTLITLGLSQWSYARVNEHIKDLLKACAALDGRDRVNVTDYNLLIKLLQPLQLERYIVETYGFEAGRVFDNNLYCILVELASFGHPTIQQICVDYKVSARTAERLIKTVSTWCWIKSNSPKWVLPTDRAKEILNLCGANQKW